MANDCTPPRPGPKRPSLGKTENSGGMPAGIPITRGKPVPPQPGMKVSKMKMGRPG